jgi:hypothetical protein
VTPAVVTIAVTANTHADARAFDSDALRGKFGRLRTAQLTGCGRRCEQAGRGDEKQFSHWYLQLFP